MTTHPFKRRQQATGMSIGKIRLSGRNCANADAFLSEAASDLGQAVEDVGLRSCQVASERVGYLSNPSCFAWVVWRRAGVGSLLRH